MADVPVVISFTRVPRVGSTPSNPPIFENPQDPVNPDGSGIGVDRFLALKDVFETNYTDKAGFVPVVNAGETGLELVEFEGDGIKLNGKIIGGVKTTIQESDVLDIPELWEYNITKLNVDGIVNVDGEINYI